MTATPLERQVDATLAAMAAWCYPSDLAVREACIIGCRMVGVDYVEHLAGLLTQHQNLTADGARWATAMALMQGVVGLRTSGAAPRMGVCATGEPADDLGIDPRNPPTLET